MVSFSKVIQSFSLGPTYLLLHAFTHFISFSVRFCLLLVVVYVPRSWFTVWWQLFPVTGSQGRQVDWSTRQTLLGSSTGPWWSLHHDELGQPGKFPS